MNLENTLAIKLSATEVPAKACMDLKKLTGLSLGEIKKRAANDEYSSSRESIRIDSLE